MKKDKQRSVTVASIDVGRFYVGNSLALRRFITDSAWDIICLHGLPEYLVHDAGFRNEYPIGEFRALTNHFMQGRVKVHVGNGIFSRKHPFVSVSAYAPVGNVLPVPNLDVNAIRIAPDGNASACDYKQLEKSENRIIVFATIEVGGEPLTIGTYDAPWRPPGASMDDSLRKSTKKLAACISKQGDNLLLAGGFHPTDSEPAHLLIGECDQVGKLLHYDMPDHVVNTIDWEARGRAGPPLVVDYFLRSESVRISNIATHPKLSKNFGISATVAW